jgi:riboflavin synthase
VFSGIVEAVSPITDAKINGNLIRIQVARPTEFTDIKTGDSIASSGVCLTVESFDDASMTFALGEETLTITKWKKENLVGQHLNLERSLKLGDRIHGHWVSGHVDTVGTIVKMEQNESWLMDVEIPQLDTRFMWVKGCVAINGISLTINNIQNNVVSFCLIPETVERTNLKTLKISSYVNIEYDYWAKAFVNYQKSREASL